MYPRHRATLHLLSVCHRSSPKANASAATQLIVDLSHKLDSICSDAPEFYLRDLDH